MNCESVELISALPYPYYKVYGFGSGWPSAVIDEYIKLFRKELNMNTVLSFITYDYRIFDRLEYLIKIYNLPRGYVFNFNIPPSQIEEIYLENKRTMGNTKFIGLINVLTGNDGIFTGDDLSGINNILECRSFKIYQTLY